MMFFYRFRGAILSWVMVPLSLASFLMSLSGMLWVAYHPSAPTVHLIAARCLMFGVAVLVFIYFAAKHSSPAFRIRVFRNALQLAVVVVACWAVYHLLAAFTGRSDHLRRTYREETYSIPRTYRPIQSRQEAANEYLGISICFGTGSPIYMASCRREMIITLKLQPMIQQFRIQSSLDQAGARYEGDFLFDNGDGAISLPDGSFFYQYFSEFTRFLLDEKGKIMRFSKCDTRFDWCDVSVRTDQGLLSFLTRDTGATDFWREEEAQWLAKFESWKCDDPSCGGLYEQD